MWLPAPLYESLPYLYILCGALFNFGTVYIGPTAPGATLYIACGLVSFIHGVVVLVRRQVHRSTPEQAEIEFAETA
jgi:hypothetical protein